MAEPDDIRGEMLSRWDRAATGWETRVDDVRSHSMPISEWMLDRLALAPGQRVLELAAGPGDTGFLAAELVAPGGTVITSDASEAMLDVARRRAAALGVRNVEFAQLQLEWIDLGAASVDAVLCRWGLMLVVDPAAAATEMRRVLRPGGRAAVAVWDLSEHNPWATVPMKALISLGHVSPPDPRAPGMFALAQPGQLQELLEAAGFVDVVVEPVELPRVYAGVDAFLSETLDLSRIFADVFAAAGEADQSKIVDAIRAGLEPYADAEGALHLQGRSLAALAHA